MPTVSPLQELKPTLDHMVQLLQEIEGSGFRSLQYHSLIEKNRYPSRSQYHRIPEHSLSMELNLTISIPTAVQLPPQPIPTLITQRPYPRPWTPRKHNPSNCISIKPTGASIKRFIPTIFLTNVCLFHQTMARSLFNCCP